MVDLSMDKGNRLEKLKQEMLRDKGLPLRKQATKLVFGEGNPGTEFLFIGEGPGYWEDQKGVPFVGNAGALLNHLLGSIDLERDSVFITNVVHYRPPQNRDPMPEELQAFQPYLDRIIEIIEPKVIVTLGRYSMGKFLPGAMISKVHGQKQPIKWKGRDIVVVPMYHPAAALRSTQIKKYLYKDFQKIKEALQNSAEPEEKKEIKIEAEQMNLL